MSERDGRHDFDFLHGRWRIVNERLVDRLQDSTDWETFQATGVVRPILGGTGNVDEYATDHWPGFEALSLRIFNPATGLWSIHWADTRVGTLLPPTVGCFQGARGDFYGDEVIDGRDIKVHFLWADVDTDRPSWAQTFSADGGETWETNWRMSFIRIHDEPDASRTSTVPSSFRLPPPSSPAGVA